MKYLFLFLCLFLISCGTNYDCIQVNDILDISGGGRNERCIFNTSIGKVSAYDDACSAQVKDYICKNTNFYDWVYVKAEQEAKK